jgi:hypothetical protein
MEAELMAELTSRRCRVHYTIKQQAEEFKAPFPARAQLATFEDALVFLCWVAKKGSHTTLCLTTTRGRQNFDQVISNVATSVYGVKQADIMDRRDAMHRDLVDRWPDHWEAPDGPRPDSPPPREFYTRAARQGIPVSTGHAPTTNVWEHSRLFAAVLESPEVVMTEPRETRSKKSKPRPKKPPPPPQEHPRSKKTGKPSPPQEHPRPKKKSKVSCCSFCFLRGIHGM